MNFNTIDFFLFYAIIFVCFYLLKAKYRIYLLLVASYYFYLTWSPEFIILVLFSTLIDFFIGKKIYLSQNKKAIFWLRMSILCNLALLFTFKYYNFFGDVFFRLTDIELTKSSLPLPIAISYYTFQTLSYSIDVYRKKVVPEKNIIRFALYVCFFPQLLAGPIERSNDLLPQLSFNKDYDYDSVSKGLIIFAWGLILKMAMADRIAPFTKTLYSNPDFFDGATHLLGAYFCAYQLYGDFGGYSLIAIGIAKTFGVKLSMNFSSPFYSSSFSEFWKRWHMTLTSWLKDYIYFPLGGSRKSLLNTLRNIIIVFFLSGLWHGANYTYIFFGLFFAIGFCLEVIIKHFFKLSRIPVLSVFIVFNVCALSQVFFRSAKISDSFLIFRKIFGDFNFKSFVSNNLFSYENMYFVLVMITIIMLVDLYNYISERSALEKLYQSSAFVKWNFYLLMSIVILFFGDWGAKDFIYFYY